MKKTYFYNFQTIRRALAYNRVKVAQQRRRRRTGRRFRIATKQILGDIDLSFCEDIL